MPRGLLQEAVCHPSGGGGETGVYGGYGGAGGKASYGSAASWSLGRCRGIGVSADEHCGVGAAMRNPGKVRPLHVVFADFLSQNEDTALLQAPSGRALPSQMRGRGRMTTLSEALDSLEAELENSNPAGPGAQASPQAQVIEYWETAGPSGDDHKAAAAEEHHGGSSAQETHHGGSQAQAQAKSDDHAAHGGGGGGGGSGSGGAREKHPPEDDGGGEPTVVMIDPPTEHLTPTVLAGGALAIFAQVYLWGNIFVTLFKPQRRPPQNAGREGGEADAAAAAAAGVTGDTGAPVAAAPPAAPPPAPAEPPPLQGFPSSPRALSRPIASAGGPAGGMWSSQGRRLGD